MTAPYPPQPPYRPAPHQGPYRPGPYGPPSGFPPPGFPPPGGPYPPWQRPGPPPSRMQPWVVALIVAAVVVVLAAVALAAGGSSGRGTAPTPGAAGDRTGDCPGGSLEGCYTEGQMRQFLGQAVTFVHGFSDDRYTRMPHPAGYQLIGPGEQARSACGTLDTMTYAFCPADDRIYIGQKQLWQFYSGIGDAAAVVGLAHEYGHHIQAVAGVPDDRSPQGQVRHENQADCIAGAFVGWAKEKGHLEEGDTRDISGLVAAIASSEDDPGRDHGTLAERESALVTGIRDGLPGCSAFYPQTPVHQST